jgi:hypothetical protein
MASAANFGHRCTRLQTSTAWTGQIAPKIPCQLPPKVTDKRGAAYEEVIAALQYRQMKRQHELRMYRLDEGSEQQLKDFFASYAPPGWFQAQARLRALSRPPPRVTPQPPISAMTAAWAASPR